MLPTFCPAEVGGRTRGSILSAASPFLPDDQGRRAVRTRHESEVFSSMTLGFSCGPCRGSGACANTDTGLEIAARLGITRQEVASILNSALVKLRTHREIVKDFREAVWEKA